MIDKRGMYFLMQIILHKLRIDLQILKIWLAIENQNKISTNFCLNVVGIEINIWKVKDLVSMLQLLNTDYNWQKDLA